MGSQLPSYGELPVRDGLPPGSSWGLWGSGDVLGSLNLLTPERVAAGLAAVRRGAVFSLNLEMELPNPPFGNRPTMEHRLISLEAGLGNDDEYSAFNVQASSQLDGFSHVQHPVHGYYGGLPQEEHSVHHWARRGIVTRGVLVDVARWRAEKGRPLAHGTTDVIEPEDLLGAIHAQGSTFEPGDLLMVHTGALTWYRGLDEQARAEFAPHPQMPGLARGTRMAAALWDLHPCAVAADNIALEAWPPERPMTDAFVEPEAAADILLHTAIIPLLGIPIGELWDLGALAADCAGDDTYDCLVTCAPMNKLGGVASMANALAIR